MRRLGAVAALAVLITGVSFVEPPDRARALSGSEFDPGYIISDERFFDYTAMSQEQIQQFLNAMVPTCRAVDPTLPCLKNLITSTNTRAPQAPGHCTGYVSEGWESAARIIWRVAQACRINPQVILATLQKEQSLVTATRPTSWQYRAAMGADCPDTAPCAATTNGFFNQVYKAAWQMRQYTYSPSPWRHHIGLTEVLWSPNSACGSSIVNIRNQATANLYNYTPYRPNAASLNNLYGSGDGCSTYGNRNFWRFFNEWFGASTANGVSAINAVVTALGGESGVLGGATSLVHSIAERGGGTAQAFQGGSVYWTIRTGAHAVLEPERSRYFVYDGALGTLGWPTSGRIPISENSDAYGQAFTTGSIYVSDLGAHATFGAIRDAYFSRGGAAGWLGFPSTEPVTVHGGTVQDFRGGALFVETSGRSNGVSAALLEAYRNVGAQGGELGWPRSETVSIPQNGGGLGQVFEYGSLYQSSAGAFVVSGGIRDFYFSRQGSAGSLGWPTASAVCTSPTSCTQSFQGGTVYWELGAGARVGSPAIEAYYSAQGGSGGALGTRTSEAVRIPANGGGTGQTFTGGSVYASDAGVFSVSNPVRALYWSLGGSAGTLGWPTGEWQSTTTPTQGSQTFQNGTIFVEAVSGAYVGLPAIDEIWWSAGGPTGWMGPRTSALISIPQNGGGQGMAFRNASVYASPAGAFAVGGGIRSAYFSLGGAAGSLGWPTGNEACSSDSCSQQFQGGQITYSASLGVSITP